MNIYIYMCCHRNPRPALQCASLASKARAASNHNKHSAAKQTVHDKQARQASTASKTQRAKQAQASTANKVDRPVPTSVLLLSTSLYSSYDFASQPLGVERRESSHLSCAGSPKTLCVINIIVLTKAYVYFR